MQVAKMGAVDEILLQLLPDAGDRPTMAPIARPLAPPRFIDALELEARRRSGRMPPSEENAALLHDGPARDTAAIERRVRTIGNGRASAGAVEGPTVERAAEALAVHSTAMSKMGAQMRTVGIE